MTTSASETAVGGVGFLISGRSASCIGKIEAFSDRVLRIRLTAGITTDSHAYIISAYSPTDSATSQEKDRFYSALDTALNDIPRRDMFYVLGDFNASVRKRNLHDQTSSNNSDRLLAFLAESQLTSIRSRFMKKPSQWFTHCGPKSTSARLTIASFPPDDRAQFPNVRIRSVHGLTSDHRLG